MAEASTRQDGDEQDTDSFEDASEDKTATIIWEPEVESEEKMSDAAVLSAPDKEADDLEEKTNKDAQTAAGDKETLAGQADVAPALSGHNESSLPQPLQHTEELPDRSRDPIIPAINGPSHGGMAEATNITHEVAIGVVPETKHAIPARSPSPPPKKKLFGWLSRSSSNTDKIIKPPPPLPPRQHTTTSISAFTSSHSNVPRVGEPHTETLQSNRDSLRSRFNQARLREESGVGAIEEMDEYTPLDVSAGASVPDGETKRAKGAAISSPISPVGPPQFDEDLAPGTAIGVSAGPSVDILGPVDWDLWQEVVYEGPAAVARTSADELNLAITRGIPSAIRGVVWQVLAQSKNDDLEAVYRDLVARSSSLVDRRVSDFKPLPTGFGKVEMDSFSRRSSAPVLEGNMKGRERIESSASSIHSETSNAESAVNGTVSSPITSQDGNGIDPLGKASADAIAEERNRVKAQMSLQKLEKAIRRDLGARTSFSKFLMSANLQDGLFGLCKAYALFDEEVGYAQGMNFIAMPLLFNMPEEEAFCLFVRLMNQYRLRDLFIPEMPGLHLHLYQFERLLEDFEPAVYCHLHRRGVTPQLYATQWFLTLFAYRFPLQLVLRIYDLILSEGLETAILKFGMVLMQKNAHALLEMRDMAELTTFLKERLFDVYIDNTPSATSMLESGFFGSASGIDKEVYRADALVQDACAIRITPELLKTYAGEWEEKVRDEREKQASEDGMKASNASLTLQVRSMQERIEKSDLEHVEVASELVHTKVANQKLRDENESLKMRVTELQTIVEAQPGEVEDRLRQEMDRIMQRNIEVQNENRALEESTAEMEGELVRAKLSHAEISGELETMRRKWSNITAMMSAPS